MVDSYNILIVDDSDFTRAMVKRVINMSGLPVGSIHEARNGSAALQVLESQLASHPVDLILTDLNMPEMDGVAFLRRVRADRRHDSVPAIVISAQPENEKTQTALRDTFQGWLPKPFTPEAARTAIVNALQYAGGGSR